MNTKQYPTRQDILVNSYGKTYRAMQFQMDCIKENSEYFEPLKFIGLIINMVTILKEMKDVR